MSLNILERINNDCLDLSGLGLHEIPEMIKTLSFLKKIDLSNNNIDSVGEHAFDNLNNLEELNLSHNKLKRFWFELDQIKTLKVLDLSHNSLETLSFSPGNMDIMMIELASESFMLLNFIV